MKRGLFKEEVNDCDLQEEKQHVHISRSSSNLEEYLNQTIRFQPKLLSFSYITTEADPSWPGERILCCSMCWQNTRSFSWNWKETPIKLFRKILENPNTIKATDSKKMMGSWTELRVPRTSLNNHFELVIDDYSIFRYNNKINEENKLLFCGYDSLFVYRKAADHLIKTGMIK